MADVSKAEEGEKSHGKIVREEGAIAQTQDDAVKLLSRKLNNALERIESQENTINDILESQKREKEALSAKYESIFELIAEGKDKSENDDGAAVFALYRYDGTAVALAAAGPTLTEWYADAALSQTLDAAPDFAAYQHFPTPQPVVSLDGFGLQVRAPAPLGRVTSMRSSS